MSALPMSQPQRWRFGAGWVRSDLVGVCASLRLSIILTELVFPVSAERGINSQRSWREVRLIGSDACAKKTIEKVSPFQRGWWFNMSTYHHHHQWSTTTITKNKWTKNQNCYISFLTVMLWYQIEGKLMQSIDRRESDIQRNPEDKTYLVRKRLNRG